MNLQDLLNKEQYQAATSQSRHLRIIAGAGTGKTRTLTYRLAYQIANGMDPSRILAITFTNKAANEMKTRVKDLLNKEGMSNLGAPLVCTYHSFCLKMLLKEHSYVPGYEKGFQIADEDKQNKIFNEIFTEGKYPIEKKDRQYVRDQISRFKTIGLLPDEITSSDLGLNPNVSFQKVEYCYSSYQKELKSQRLMDFDDLLLYAYKLLKNNENIKRKYSNKYQSIMVDEFQDTNRIQYEIVYMLLNDFTQFTVVGDPDQNIYSFRGAEGNIIKKVIPNDFKDLQTVILDENYRSTQNILDAANLLISHNREREKKNLVAYSRESGTPVYYQQFRNQKTEAQSVVNEIKRLNEEENINYSDMAIIYRNNYLSLDIETQLRESSIPYQMYGGLKFYDRAEVKATLAYLQLAIYPDDLSLQRVLKAPTRGIGSATILKATELEQSLPQPSTLYEVFRYHSAEIPLSGKCKEQLDILFNALDAFKLDLCANMETDDLIDSINKYLLDSGFLAFIKSEDDKNQKKEKYSTSKKENVKNLFSEIRDYFDAPSENDLDNEAEKKTLDNFLLSVNLIEATDDDDKDDSNKVSLMTCHVSKGLEFKVVFVMGLADGIFPSMYALADSSLAVEEERRLFYVAMTRAKIHLYLSTFGIQERRRERYMSVSDFIAELKGDSEFGSEKVNLQRFPNPKSSDSNLNVFGINPNDFINNKNDQSPLADSDYQKALLNRQRRQLQNSNNYKNTNLQEKKVLSALETDIELYGKDEINNAREDKEDVYPKDFIIHKTFGLGQVQEVDGDKVVVQFENDDPPKNLRKGFKAFYYTDYKGDFPYGQFATGKKS